MKVLMINGSPRKNGNTSIALEEMKKMPDASVDFIFMDAAKAQYVHYLKEAVRLMKKGAVLVADNVFQEGDLIESRYIVTRRDRTIHSRICLLYTSPSPRD
mgnify:CR=1 FL=1